MIQIIIFSKDRGLQLELLLRSLNKHIIDISRYQITVLYKYSTDFYKQGYDKTISKYSNINFVKENSFKEDLIKLIDNNIKMIMFLVDDNVFVNDFNLDCREIDHLYMNNAILSVSLRLDCFKNFCYTENKFMSIPKLNDGRFKYNEILNNGDWSYKYSLDGDIFRTEDILNIISQINFRSPNTLEGSMQSINSNREFKLCFNKAKLFNIPVNRVQIDNNNRCGDVSSEYLNRMYLGGYIIDLEPIEKENPKSCHHIVKLNFIKE